MAEQDFHKIVTDLRQTFNMGKTRSMEFRRRQLKALLAMYKEHTWDFIDALAKDLHKPTEESVITEVNLLINEVEYLIDNLDQLVEPEKVPPNTVTILDSNVIYHDPYGVVLVIGAWNYPFLLPMSPVSGAIAAGNCVVIKPSEVSSATEAAIMKYVPLYLDQDSVRVVTGGIGQTTALLNEKFDYIFFTGSTDIGKIVRDAANKHLTPTTLELGGKCPVYLDDSVNWDIAVRRIIWGKFLNLGQTCVCPDYLLCTKSVQEKFIAKAKEVMKEFYGGLDKLQESPDLCRIINDKNFKRVASYLKDGTAVIGGNYDADDRWIEPTILTDVDPKSKVMQEEIFGPIFPIINVESVHEAINFINARESKPLALYIFSTIPKIQELFKAETSSGALSVNDVVVHFSLLSLPFGGVGSSGMGAYHGKASFETFAHKKSILGRNYNPLVEYVGSHRYPPYSEQKYKFLTWSLKERKLPPLAPFCYLMAFGLGALSLYVAQLISRNEEE